MWFTPGSIKVIGDDLAPPSGEKIKLHHVYFNRQNLNMSNSIIHTLTQYRNILS